MRFSSASHMLLSAVAGAAGVLGTTSSHPPAAVAGVRRQLLTCEATYGAGSLQCGGDNSTMCYNPTIGQTCCPTDNGFCEKGTYCAPVAGFCCLETEDVSTCAKNAGFTLPSPLASSSAPSTTLSIGAGAAPTGALGGVNTPASNHSAPGGGSGGSPYVQVSGASYGGDKVDRSAAWWGGILGSVAAVALLC